MDWLGVILSFVGAALSGVGVYFAWCQALKALHVRQGIEVDRKRITIIESVNWAGRAREEVVKLLRGTAKGTRGIDPQSVVDKIRDCLHDIKDGIHRIQNPELSNLLDGCISQINAYPNGNQDVRYEIAGSLYNDLANLRSGFQEIKDENI